MAGGGGGAWKVAYADFVTAMMAFFLVMWLVGQSKEVKTAVAHYFQPPPGAVAAELDPDVEPSLFPPRAELKIFHDIEKTRNVGTMVLFAEKTYALDESAINQLEALLPDLLGKPNKIEIRGHASRRERADIQSKEDPWQLSWMRSQAVKDFLVSKGVELGRLRLSQDGAEEPYSAKKLDAEHQAQNARVEVFLIGELARKYRESPDEPGGFFGKADPSQVPPGQSLHAKPKTDSHAPEKVSGHGSSGHGSSGHGSSSGHGAKKEASGHGSSGHGSSSHGAKTETKKAEPKKSSGHH